MSLECEKGYGRDSVINNKKLRALAVHVLQSESLPLNLETCFKTNL